MVQEVPVVDDVLCRGFGSLQEQSCYREHKGSEARYDLMLEKQLLACYLALADNEPLIMGL